MNAENHGADTKICALCLQPKALQSSHLISKFVYRRVNRLAKPGVSPLRADPDVRRTDEQWEQPLLCSDCEGRLNTGGEDYAAKYLLPSRNAGWPGLAQVVAHQLQELGRQLRLDTARENRLGPADCGYSLTCLGVGPGLLRHVDAGKLYHWVVGMIWKAGCTAWPRLEPLRLDPEFMEQMRLYLLGDAGWVSRWTLRVVVTLEHEKWSIVPPMNNRRGGVYFNLLGYDFLFLPNNREDEALATGGLAPVRFVCDPGFSAQSKALVIRRISQAHVTRTAAAHLANVHWIKAEVDRDQ